MNADEWRDELDRLSIRPGGGPPVMQVYWRTWLDRNRQPHYRHRECPRAVRAMSPLERAAYNEGASLGRDARALRIGRNSWLVETPHAGRGDALACSSLIVRR